MEVLPQVTQKCGGFRSLTDEQLRAAKRFPKKSLTRDFEIQSTAAHETDIQKHQPNDTRNRRWARAYCARQRSARSLFLECGAKPRPLRRAAARVSLDQSTAHPQSLVYDDIIYDSVAPKQQHGNEMTEW